MHTRQAFIYALTHSLMTNLTSLSWSKQSQINTCWQIITLKIKGQYFKITSFVSIESKYQKINNQMECGLDSRIPPHLHFNLRNLLPQSRTCVIYILIILCNISQCHRSPADITSFTAVQVLQFSKHVTVVTQRCIIIPIPTL